MDDPVLTEELKTLAYKCLRARLRILLPFINTVYHEWQQAEFERVPDRFRGPLNKLMRDYVQAHLNIHSYDPNILNMDMIWKAIITGKINLQNAVPDIIAPKTLGTGQWADTPMSWITLPAIGLLVMAEALADLEILLG